MRNETVPQNWTLLPGDCQKSLKMMADKGIFVDSVVTDPPYHLTSIVKRFGGNNAAAKFGTDGAFSRASAGFMGQSWDGGDIAHDPEFWALVFAVMKPGAYVAAFSSTRTGHRQACAMEDAGFIMHPMLGWAFGSGFPKAHNAAKAIDKQLGTPGTYEGVKPGHEAFVARGTQAYDSLAESGSLSNEGGFSRPWMKDPEAVARYHKEYAPGSPEAEQWLGWAYGGQSLKPAFEPIYLAQKPFSEKNGALNILKHGVGAVNLDGCRTGGEGGRHPANLLHDGSPEVVGMFPQSKGKLAAVGPKNGLKKSVNVYGDYGPRDVAVPRGDEGSAARFFGCFPPDSDPLFYAAKASKVDRAGSKHPTVKPQSLMRWLCRLITPPGGLVLDPFAGSGSTGQAAVEEGFRIIMMEREEDFLQDIRNRMAKAK